MVGVYQLLMRTIQTTLAPHAQPSAAPVAPVSTPVVAASAPGPNPCHEVIDVPSGTYIDHCSPAVPPRYSPAQSRQAQERADDAIRVIEDSTPEL